MLLETISAQYGNFNAQQRSIGTRVRRKDDAIKNRSWYHKKNKRKIKSG
jgi:hypothetical protein